MKNKRLTERQQLVLALAQGLAQLQQICGALHLTKAHKITDHLAAVALAELKAHDKRTARSVRE